MSGFQGLPAARREFFADLAQDNSKDFWDANRRRWQRDVKAPMSALVDELSNEFGPLRMFRPNRDLPAAEERTARLADRPSPHQLLEMERAGSHSAVDPRCLAGCSLLTCAPGSEPSGPPPILSTESSAGTLALVSSPYHHDALLVVPCTSPRGVMAIPMSADRQGPGE